ncbi:MAG: NADH-quinone oxidoreductase subunit C, partial [Bacteriovoracaceae bacterium]|nr:NADH-quinone oxidoreductase subunit C [Bacteriovoracaceae bacterium]
MSTFLENLRQEFDQNNFQVFKDGAEATCSVKNLSILAGVLKEKYNFIFLLDICAIDLQGKSNSENRFELVYHFLNLEEFFKLRLVVPVDESKPVASLEKLWSGAKKLESESREMFGLEFNSDYKPCTLDPEDFGGFPLRKDYTGSAVDVVSVLPTEFPEDLSLDNDQRGVRSWVNIGPHHPVMKNNIRLMLELEGEYIRRSQIETGFYHRGWEKQAESFNYHQIIALTERLNHQSPFIASTIWCRLIEESLSVVIPDRSMAIRMVFIELSRIHDHLNCIGHCAVAGGNESVFFLCQHARELVYELFEKMTGSRMNPSLNKIGGLKYDLPIGWVTDCFEALKKIEEQIDNVNQLFTKSSIWLDRNMVCEINALRALELGITGPVLRGSGVNYDLRKVEPCYFYSDVDFEIPLGVKGQSYDRYLVRMEEMRQSMSIIIQVLDNLPTGDICLPEFLAPCSEINMPHKGVYSSM